MIIERIILIFWSYSNHYNSMSLKNYMCGIKTRQDASYICVLVGSDSYKLGLWKVEALRLHVTANVLHPILRHLHDVQPWLVLMQRLQDNHLHK